MPAKSNKPAAAGRAKADRLTPAMQQYLETKRAHPDALIFFRMGDFYELFFEDATTAAPILEIALTTREKNRGEDAIPMCGVPYHAGAAHVRRLVERGFKVALCEQVEDPAQAKGLIRREVVRLITPGMPPDDQASALRDHYVLALAPGNPAWGLAAVDAATANFPVTELDAEGLLAEIARLDPAELVLPEGAELPASLGESLRLRPRTLTRRPDLEFRPERAEPLLAEQFAVGSLEGFGFPAGSPALAAAGALVAYLREANRSGVAHVRELHPYRAGGGLVVDESSRDNLEIFRGQQERTERGSLVAAIDRTLTTAGARCLRRWLLEPLLDLGAIEARQGAVADLIGRPALRESLREGLAKTADLERIVGRVCQGRASPREVMALAATLEGVPALRKELCDSDSKPLAAHGAALRELPEVSGRIREVLADEPPASVAEGGLVRAGYSDELDHLREIRSGGKAWIARLEASERERTGIGSLKIRYNKVFGYYIEVTKTHLASVPDDYVRKQTLVNAERFITPGLKEYESKVLSADERIRSLEQEIFVDLCAELAGRVAPLQDLARRLAELDVLASFADQAVRAGYVRPTVHAGAEIVIAEGRHPVVEASGQLEHFVPNDLEMDGQEGQVLIITGPNMAGKSTVMRQVALIVLLAQVGSFVPAKEARIGLVDRIFTRVGASDNLARGLSTFMLEMTETAAILRQATPRSLVLMDEIGRGTSTFDGLSIAWAVAEALHELGGKGVRTLFATHYHELTELAQILPRVKNLTMQVKEWNERILFLRKLVPGAASRSYGIHVARLAGIPDPVVGRAREILANLEAGEWDPTGAPRLAKGTQPPSAAPEEGRRQLSLLAAQEGRLDKEFRRALEAADPDALTPLDALTWIAKWKARLGDEKS